MSGKTTASLFGDPRVRLGLIALLLALGEITSVFANGVPLAVAIVFGVLFVAGALWIRRGGIGGPIFVGALCAFEVSQFPFWDRDTTGNWISQIVYAAVSLAGLLVAIAVIKLTVGARKAGATTARLQA